MRKCDETKEIRVRVKKGEIFSRTRPTKKHNLYIHKKRVSPSAQVYWLFIFSSCEQQKWHTAIASKIEFSDHRHFPDFGIFSGVFLSFSFQDLLHEVLRYPDVLPRPRDRQNHRLRWGGVRVAAAAAAAAAAALRLGDGYPARENDKINLTYFVF